MSAQGAAPGPAGPDPVTSATGDEQFSLTRPSPWLRGYLVRNYPLRKLLPDREPAYVSSVLYTMGVLTLAALIVAAAYGAVAAGLALFGKSQVQRAVPPIPDQTSESVKEDVQWTKTRAQEARN